LAEALNGDERDATRAREIIRSFIDHVTVVPADHVDRTKGRGNGPLRVIVEGAITKLVDQSLLDKKIMHSRGARAVHDLPIATFRYYVDIPEEMTAEERQVRADLIILRQLLDNTGHPVLYRAMVEAVNAQKAGADLPATEDDERRSRLALAYLKRRGLVRMVRLGRMGGWVWNGTVSDDECRRRFDQRHEIPDPMPVIRLSHVEGHVAVVGVRVAAGVDA
jgi:hypothetical protein